MPYWRPKGVRGTIVLSNLLSQSANGGGSSFPTSSISPTDGAYVIVSVMTNRTGVGTVVPVTAISGAGITFARIVGTDPLNPGVTTETGYSVWGGFAPTPSLGGALTITTAAPCNDARWIVSQATNVDTTTPVVQSTTAAAGVSAVSTVSASLVNPVENANNVSFSAAAWSSNLIETNITYNGLTSVAYLRDSSSITGAISHAWALNSTTGGYTWSGGALRMGMTWFELKSAIV